MRTNKRTFSAAEVRPRSELMPLDLLELFARAAPLEVDLGCGDGGFLVALAEQFPERNFIGIERLPGRVRSACRKIGDRGLANARVVARDVLPSVQQLFARASVDRFHLLFPDPWPKRRHHSRRVFDRSFLLAVARALKMGGRLRVATDDAEYFAAMKNVLHDAPRSLSAVSDQDIEMPLSSFESRFRQRNHPIFRLTLARR